MGRKPGVDSASCVRIQSVRAPQANREAAMSATGAAREDRIELRATKEEKRILATAAAYERLDVTSFIMRNVLPAAREVVERAERIVLSERDTVRVLGLYSISPGSIDFARVPAKLTRKLGRYDVPVFRLGRLAIDRSVQGQGLGSDLFLAAGERALAVSAEVGGVALAIDAKDENAARWYERFGALPLLDDPLKLILPLATIG